MTERKQCEFQLIRYVPDPVRNEFVNIGVLLRSSAGEQSLLRFTRDWSRVRCLDPDADIPMLEALEIEVAQRIQDQAADPGKAEHAKPIRVMLEGSLSNGIQITETKAHLAETFLAGLDDLMRLYIDSPRRERTQRRGGRAAIVASMRMRFEEAGVWALMRKQIAVARYTLPGDPLRIDCGYSNGMTKMFHAISLESNADDAKVLAFAAPRLLAGVKKETGKDLELTAIIEPIVWPAGDSEPSEDRTLLYDYANEIMKEQEIRIMTTAQLPQIAQTARKDLRI